MNGFVNLLTNNSTALEFDGTQRYKIPTNLFPSQGRDYSVCYWLKWDQPDQEWSENPYEFWTCVYRKTNDNPDGTSHSRIPAGFINSSTDTLAVTSGHSDNWNLYDKGNQIQRHRWYHVTHVVSNTNQTSTVYVYDPSTTKYEIVETPLTGTVNTNNEGYFYIGGDEFFAGFIGVLADMRWYYDTALTTKQVKDISRQIKHTTCCIAEESIAIDFQLEHGGCIELEECLISNYTIDVSAIPTIINWNTFNGKNEPYTVDLDKLFEPLHTESHDTATDIVVYNSELDENNNPVLHDLQDRYEVLSSGERLPFNTHYKLSDGTDLRDVFAAWGTTSSLAYITATPKYVGFNDLSWLYTIETDPGTSIPSNAKYKYEIATDPFMTNIIKSDTLDTFKEEYVFTDLQSHKRYYSRLSIDVPGGKDSVSNISQQTTDPCQSFHATRIDDSTIRIVTEPHSIVTTVEDSTPDQRMRGVVTPVANDQYGNLFIGVGEGLSTTNTTGRGGRMVFDGGFPKFLKGYWSEDYRTDIYNRPAQWGFLHNSIKYISRSKNNKVLLIAEQHYGGNYGSNDFTSGVRGVCEAYLNKTVELLDGSSGRHINIIANSSRTSVQWRDYFKQYDCIIYFASSKEKTGRLTTAFIEGLIDYIDSGGGMFVSSDHTDSGGAYPVHINMFLKYYGVSFTGFVNRTSGNAKYRMSHLLSNTEYIPDGYHPLFENISPTSYIYAGNSEGILTYINADGTTKSPTGSDTSGSTTVNHKADSNGIVDLTTSSKGKVIIRTANDCGDIIYSD